MFMYPIKLLLVGLSRFVEGGVKPATADNKV